MNDQSNKGHTLTIDEEILKNMVHEFAKKEIRPAAVAYDREPDPDRKILQPVVEKALSTNGLGLGMVFIPIEYGGSGYGLREQALVVEEMAWGDLGLVLNTMGNIHSAPAILALGTEEQKQRWLPAMAGGESPGVLVSVAVTEPNTGANVFSDNPKSGIKTRARHEDGQYVINGQKCFINNAGLSDLYLVWARTESGQISVFFVPADTPGLKIGKKEDLMGIKTSQLAEVIFEDCRVPDSHILGPEGSGFLGALIALPGVATLMGAAAVGLARAAYEAADTYASRRVTETFPINQHQAVSHKLVDMAMMIEAARSLVFRTAILLDQGSQDFKLPLMCKIFGAETAQRVTADAVEIMGAYGYSREFPVEKYMRDAKSLQVNSPDMVMRNHLSHFIKRD